MANLNPESKFSLSIKEIVGAVVGLSSLFGIYFTMQSSIANAQESIEDLKTNSVQKVEFTFKDELIRNSIEKSFGTLRPFGSTVAPIEFFTSFVS